MATTGAEALYSDMGHVGKINIYASWPYVKTCLLLNYLGQGAWPTRNNDLATATATLDFNPFFEMLPQDIRLFAVILSTLAAVIASQSLITGSFTLVSEAIRLGLMPHLQIRYPAETKGQMFIPLVNSILLVLCLGVVFFFRSSARMEAAYGLAITVTMLMTTILLFNYMRHTGKNLLAALLMLVFFGSLEAVFFLSSASKFLHGGYVAVFIALALLAIMVIWYFGNRIENTQACEYPLADFVPQLGQLKNDEHLPLLANNLVYLTTNPRLDTIEREILYSILDKRPKRAEVYWFINIQVTDNPYTKEYIVENFGTNYCFKVQLNLGFKVDQRINVFLRQIVNDLLASGEIKPQTGLYSMYEQKEIGDFHFILIQHTLPSDGDFTAREQFIMQTKYAIKQISGSAIRWFGLETASSQVEHVPLFLRQKTTPALHRVKP